MVGWEVRGSDGGFQIRFGDNLWEAFSSCQFYDYRVRVDGSVGKTLVLVFTRMVVKGDD